MNDDAYYLRRCKLSLLAAAAIHWIGAAMLLSSHLNDESTWQYSGRSIRRLAAAALHAIIAS